MGHKLSAVTGAKTDRYYEPGNAINEVWVGDVEIISRLPFGDSETRQASWPEGGWPKIPWRNFVIPMKRAIKFTDHQRIKQREWKLIVLILISHLVLLMFASFLSPWSRARTTEMRRLLMSGDTAYRTKARNMYILEIAVSILIIVMGLTVSVRGLIIWAEIKWRTGRHVSLLTLQVLDFFLLALTLFRTIKFFLTAWRNWRRVCAMRDVETGVELRPFHGA
ncbi:hypothetical protein BDV59DRAFT_61948 [Aspergillus ambiguus]|uniref:uncharacterized protein n=1 Tax=Aspergillus ambiguus TaxID=176160 RepID=UPI003CCDEF4C